MHSLFMGLLGRYSINYFKVLDLYALRTSEGPITIVMRVQRYPKLGNLTLKGSRPLGLVRTAITACEEEWMKDSVCFHHKIYEP
jgi:hypothetical protein